MSAEPTDPVERFDAFVRSWVEIAPYAQEELDTACDAVRGSIEDALGVAYLSGYNDGAYGD